jgi:magnesium-transporting ATPase (P-type)
MYSKADFIIINSTLKICYCRCVTVQLYAVVVPLTTQGSKQRLRLCAEAEKRLKEFGRNELPEKTTPSWLVFLKQMWAPMPIMIW